MRVTTASTFRNFTTSVNDVHLSLNKSMNKISSGELYENAAANPLAYYEGNTIDHQYLDTLAKKNLLKDVQNRIYEQEVGIRTIQTRLSEAKNNVQYANTATTTDTALDTTKSALLQKMHEMVNSLNAQYENFYVYGGNDVSTPPFSLSADGSVLSYSHTFPGESNAVTFEMTLAQEADGSYKYTLADDGNKVSVGGTQYSREELLIKAMAEQGRIDVGYGTISDRDTLLDTYTGGMNVLCGLTSDAIRTWTGNTDSSGKGVMDYLSNGPLAMVGRSVLAIGKYLDGQTDRDELNDVLSDTITDMTTCEHTISSFYSDLGNKYTLIDNLETRLNTLSDTLTEQYKEKLGADPYQAIMEMYSNNYAYNAALQVGSRLMGSSLFDFLG